MSHSGQQPVFSNDADIIVVDETMGKIDTTIRPVTGKRRKALQERLEKEAELRKLMDEYNKNNGDNKTG